jgi:hypothetical protein
MGTLLLLAGCRTAPQSPTQKPIDAQYGGYKIESYSIRETKTVVLVYNPDFIITHKGVRILATCEESTLDSGCALLKSKVGTTIPESQMGGLAKYPDDLYYEPDGLVFRSNSDPQKLGLPCENACEALQIFKVESIQ